MKGILIEPGKAPEPANLPDTLSAMETRLGGMVEHYIFPDAGSTLLRVHRRRVERTNRS